ncbi:MULTISPECIES: tetratricopeptide repeat protein [unclassified Aureimonas]|uniref:tetratricopeptide repeat protein n=1 Tax=unclassified Aureimonas TaxID=2615206 RepID=UPI0006FA5A00|nr:MULTISPECIES: tetratricopeptide repeat protein [unclassified Aureimonas]KQT65135.1 hypothetical protein ASG62_22325 [Aureimonas sp. Leaf427]KQT76215.1 hypothetical protein ASG54_15850 [Aureimonas sp. Leaf460]
MKRPARLALAALIGLSPLSAGSVLAAGTDLAASKAGIGSAQSLSGAYLAAKSAQAGGDLSAATTFYSDALTLDPTSEPLQQDAMFAFLAAGNFEQAAELAAKIRDTPEAGKVARLALGIDLLRRGSYTPAIAEFDIVDPSDLDALLIGHLSAWADTGAGNVDGALSRLKELQGATWYPIFNDYQAGLIASLAGKPDIARKSFAAVIDDSANAQVSPDAFLAAAEALARLEARDGKKTAAVAALDKGLDVADTYDPLLHLKARIEKGETIEPALSSVKEGAAETLYILGQAINRGEGQQVALLYFQLARALAPTDPNLLMALAGIAERGEHVDEAIAYYRQIPKDSALYRAARLQTGLDLWYAERKDEAKAHLRKAVADYPHDLQAYLALADVLSADKDYAESAKALDKAVEIAVPAKKETWNLYYQRGIAHERLKQWDKAEPDFRKALTLSPDQPQVLNYLGYSMVDMDRNLDEGLDMIKRAVELRPNDGYIIDSLGWAYYRLARYDDAVEQLERAVLITPVDPTINDHLGDAYWRVGRTREARFQWSRALVGEPKPEAAEVTKIEAKLKDGLPPETRKAEIDGSGKPLKAGAAEALATAADAAQPKAPGAAPAVQPKTEGVPN